MDPSPEPSPIAAVVESLPAEGDYSFLRRQIALVGDQDPLEVMAETPERLAILVADTPRRRLQAPARGGGWTANEVLGHLADMEWVYGLRTRTIFADDRPLLVGLDQDRWVSRQGQNDSDPRHWVESFTALRRVNLGFWRGLEGADLQRCGIHQEAGLEMSLGFFRYLVAGHDIAHQAQIHRILGE